MNALMKVPTLTMFLALFALVPVRAAGECVNFPLATDKKDADFVFEGTVKQVVPLEGNEVAAEIETHQVHKDTIWVPPCSGASRTSPKLVKQLGRSKKPTGVRQ